MLIASSGSQPGKWMKKGGLLTIEARRSLSSSRPDFKSGNLPSFGPDQTCGQVVAAGLGLIHGSDNPIASARTSLPVKRVGQVGEDAVWCSAVELCPCRHG